jgi:hypothetical protein
METETKELVKANEAGALATQVSAAMQEMGVSTSDLIIPRLLLMQNTSEAVGDGRAKLGDILNSQSNTVIGGCDKPVEIIPLKLFKTWRVMNVSKPQAEFLCEEPVTPENQNRDWEGEEVLGGVNTPVRYDFSYNFFVLIKNEVAEGEGFPVLISMRRTCVRAGKALATHLFKRAALQKAPYSKSVRVVVTKQKHDTNTYAIYEIQDGVVCSEAELAEGAKWMPLLATMRVDEEKSEADEKAAPAPVVMKDAGSPAQGPY